MFLRVLWESGELASVSPFAFNVLKVLKLEMVWDSSLGLFQFLNNQTYHQPTLSFIFLQAGLKYMHICYRSCFLFSLKPRFRSQYAGFPKEKKKCLFPWFWQKQMFSLGLFSQMFSSFLVSFCWGEHPLVENCENVCHVFWLLGSIGRCVWKKLLLHKSHPELLFSMLMSWKISLLLSNHYHTI